MNTTQNTGVILYQNLGKLFYAIAASDKVVHKSEYESLHNIIISKWLHVEDLKDEYGNVAAFQIEIVFDWLDYETLTAEACFQDFENFYKENINRFSDQVKELIWVTCNEIANAFSGKNKSELIMLGRLKLTLEN